jgi:uncharacterized membrane protein
MVLPVRGHRPARGVTVAVAGAVFLACWVVLHHFFYAHDQIRDTPVYEGYGLAMRHGLLPYRDIPVEYPPGALPVFVAPTYARNYEQVFGWLMAFIGVGTIAIAAAAGASRRAIALIAVSPLLLGSIMLSRYDWWPTLLVVAAVAAFVHARDHLGWAALGAAVAVKVFAVVLLPLAFVWTWRRRGTAEALVGAGLAAAVVIAGFLPFAILAPTGLWHSLYGQLSRPLQIESFGATLLTTFSHPEVIATHGSLNLAGQGAVAKATSAVELALLVCVWVAFARGPMTAERLVRYAAACVCAFVALGKVLSPQFLIWLIPLVPLVRGRRGIAASLLLVAACILTQLYFPARYADYVFQLRLAWLVLLRNVVLLALLAVLTLPARALRYSP